MQPSTNPDRRWLIALAAGMAVVLLLLYLAYGSGGSFVLRTIDYAVQNLAGRSGASVFLVRGIVIIGTIPFFWAVYKFTYGFWLLGLGVRPSLRLYGSQHGMIIVAYVGVFFVAMYFASRDALFYKWCAETPEGIRTFDSAGIDPVYGTSLKRCTQEQIEIVRNAGPQRIHVADPRVFPFFDSITGKPRVWYFKLEDGTYQFFNRAGKFPGTGEDLRPIDRGTVQELIRRRTPRGSDPESVVPELACGLGSRWDEFEAVYPSTWIRRGSSDLFEANYYTINLTTLNRVVLSGGHVHAERIGDSNGGNTVMCVYDGSFADDGKTITGQYRCPASGASLWKATVICDTAAATR